MTLVFWGKGTGDHAGFGAGIDNFGHQVDKRRRKGDKSGRHEAFAIESELIFDNNQRSRILTEK